MRVLNRIMRDLRRRIRLRERFRNLVTLQNVTGQVSNQNKAAKTRLDECTAFQAKVNQMTNWQRSQWAPNMPAQSGKI